ncbi:MULTISPECIES: DUF4355 domain-containing protein [Clostridium]|uniref:DUF4355 domain-containing protein n=2 Tax=Clostridium TaxID=1485 RepID=M1LTT6_9CLOT|nr:MULTISPECIES: DUF4355 domain-containing protein [Clostridium]AGF56455.1 hypothetical protein DUF4355 [Clostridium saccharoperbutylacetonicum N1-4(HMT)]MBC2478173.1 DUF4355 domain-containing protein [Clostridium beijerinckii]NRT62798.1 hypothetical protein [Clostridium saccharoperbutylacetonicum]NSB26152.1 hypothetical protein [Clostridium saccharoperbutylacetonicum]NSB45505.1 hypothetical protein [Clostridium saccharoperbutylacetonicum]
MKKNEIIEFLKDLADDADIDETVKGNETLSKLFEKGLSIDDVKNFLDSNEDGKKYLQSYGDGRVTKGIETFKEKNLSKLVDDEIKKRYPEKDPKELALENLQKELENMKAESAKKDLKAKAVQIANEKKVPLNLVDYFLGQDEEATTKNFDTFNDVFNNSLSVAIEEKIKGGYKPPTQTVDPVDESKMTDAEWFAAQEQKNTQN